MEGVLVFGEGANGSAGAVTALQTAFTPEAIWGTISPFIPVIGTITLVALGIYIMRRIVKKAGKGKGGM